MRNMLQLFITKFLTFYQTSLNLYQATLSNRGVLTSMIDIYQPANFSKFFYKILNKFNVGMLKRIPILTIYHLIIIIKCSTSTFLP